LRLSRSRTCEPPSQRPGQGGSDNAGCRARADHLAAPECSDEVRAQVALHAQDDERRRAAIDGIANEEVLVDVALAAEHASVRSAAPSASGQPKPLRRLLKVRGTRIAALPACARALDAYNQRIENAGAADAILQEARPGRAARADCDGGR